jgi:phosphoserine phosphatase
MKYKTVIFDFDSTLVTIEGINELARIKNVHKSISLLTEKAMNGELTFQQVFYKRLELIKPTRSDLIKVSRLYLDNITPGAQDLIRKLMVNGVHVHVISGGYEQAIMPTALHLGIPRRHIHTIRLKPNKFGFMLRPDNNSLLAKNNGKTRMLKQLDLEKKVAFIGDGCTDLSAKDSVDTFIGFGGVVKRDKVRKQSDLYISTPSLLSIYKLLH